VISLDGLIHLTSHSVALFLVFPGVMMEQSVRVLVEMVMSFLDQLLIDNFHGHISRPLLTKRTKLASTIASMR